MLRYCYYLKERKNNNKIKKFVWGNLRNLIKYIKDGERTIGIYLQLKELILNRRNSRTGSLL